MGVFNLFKNTLKNNSTSDDSSVITFKDRKKISVPSRNGLFVAEILLLEYCKKGAYPKSDKKYPSFWWYEYGIKDVDHMLQSLEKRGYLRWAAPSETLHTLKLDQLKKIISDNGMTAKGNKANLISFIEANLSMDKVSMSVTLPQIYILTEKGITETEENGYVLYMHNHARKTIDDVHYSQNFNVWSVNRLFKSQNVSDWKSIVGTIEKSYFGTDIVNSKPDEKKTDNVNITAEMRAFLKQNQVKINSGIRTSGDGYDEEIKGIDLRKAGRDREAIIQFYIAIGKRFYAPGLYRETCILLRKYKMYEEELAVIQSAENLHVASEELTNRKQRVIQLIEKGKR